MKFFLILLVLTPLISSCTINEAGELEFTWLFWFILIIFALLFIIAIISATQKESKTKENLSKRGLTPSDFTQTEASYVGGHPDVDMNILRLAYRKKDGDLLFYERMSVIDMPIYRFTIPINSISEIEIEDSTSIENKVTLGRVLLVGIFALAWKKKKKNELAFITISWTDKRFNHITILNIEGKDAMQKANILRNQLIRIIR